MTTTITITGPVAHEALMVLEAVKLRNAGVPVTISVKRGTAPIKVAVTPAAATSRAKVGYVVRDMRVRLSDSLEQVRFYLLRHPGATKRSVQDFLELTTGAPAGSKMKAAESALHAMKARGVIDVVGLR